VPAVWENPKRAATKAIKKKVSTSINSVFDFMPKSHARGVPFAKDLHKCLILKKK
jgi:hypothetical protein